MTERFFQALGMASRFTKVISGRKRLQVAVASALEFESAMDCEDFGTAPPRHFSSHGLQLHPPLTSPRSVLCIYIHSCIYSSAFPFSRYCCHRHKSTRFSLRRMRLQSISQPLSSKHAKICTVHPMFLPKMFKKQDGMLAFFWYSASDFLTKNV